MSEEGPVLCVSLNCTESGLSQLMDLLSHFESIIRTTQVVELIKVNISVLCSSFRECTVLFFHQTLSTFIKAVFDGAYFICKIIMQCQVVFLPPFVI